MKIDVGDNVEYDTGIHPCVTEIVFLRKHTVGTFFESDRFPNLVKLDCDGCQLTKLRVKMFLSPGAVLLIKSTDRIGTELSSVPRGRGEHGAANDPPVGGIIRCPSLRKLDCFLNHLTKLELNCPSLQSLSCEANQLTELELICPSLQVLFCGNNQLSELKLNCLSLLKLNCSGNRLTNLELNCPSLRELRCFGNQLTDLNGLEFCSELEVLCCSAALEKYLEILKVHLPALTVEYS